MVASVTAPDQQIEVGGKPHRAPTESIKFN